MVNAGAIRWVGKTPKEVFDEFNPETATPGLPELWDEDFNVVEVFNNSSFESNRDGNVKDWFSLLNSGRRIVAVGSSDSHKVASSPVGYPRTCLSLGTDDPAALTANQVRDVTRSGAAFISGGIYLNVKEKSSGKGPGEQVDGVGETATLSVCAQAPDWIDVYSFEVIVDGQSVSSFEDDDARSFFSIGGSGAALPGNCPDGSSAIRWADDIGVNVASGQMGSWVVVVVHGQNSMSEVHPGKIPFAVSNPIYLTR
ncbi:MAG: hypothetical protein IPJ88_11685 [Myxococcales bacterium]|nr:MAG: hypothetical protein IPJ88_11685 [Myxococcales bacterium]